MRGWGGPIPKFSTTDKPFVQAIVADSDDEEEDQNFVVSTEQAL